jgi:hypothetical protein
VTSLLLSYDFIVNLISGCCICVCIDLSLRMMMLERTLNYNLTLRTLRPLDHRLLIIRVLV